MLPEAHLVLQLGKVPLDYFGWSLTCTFSFTSLWVHHFPQGVPWLHTVPARRCLGPTSTNLLGFLTLCYEAWMKEAYFGER